MTKLKFIGKARKFDFSIDFLIISISPIKIKIELAKQHHTDKQIRNYIFPETKLKSFFKLLELNYSLC